MNELQARILSIYKEVAKLLDENGFRYFAIGGTAIGAARHKGFIPWDDDLDIAVPVDEFRRFVDVAERSLPDGLALVTTKGRPHYAQVFVKVEDVNTADIEPIVASYPDRHTGVWVDVMPMGGIPSGRLARSRYLALSRLLGGLNYRARFPGEGAGDLKGRALSCVARAGRLAFGIDYFSERLLGHIESCPFDGSDFVGPTWVDCTRLAFPREWYADYVSMPFEDTVIRMPVGWHESLSFQYGDYMQLPPPEERITHNGFVDLEHSYKDYQTGRLKIPAGCFDAGGGNG